MDPRSLVRRLALQTLFLIDSQGAIDQEMALHALQGQSEDADTRLKAFEMARGAWEWRAQSDEMVERLAPQWPPRRQPGVDRNLLRLAIWELTHKDTPQKVVIDEAIELAREFSTEESPRFVNGVLDAVLKELAVRGQGSGADARNNPTLPSDPSPLSPDPSP